MFNLPQSAIVLLLAALLDYFIGDPRQILHPVQVMGWFISTFTKGIIQGKHPKWLQRLEGIILGISLIFGSGLVSWLIIQLITLVHPVLGVIVQIIMLASCLATRSLSKAAIDVIKPLVLKDLTLARSNLSKYVGRDTENLSETEILRAVLETVAENTTDGVTAPLFYSIVGAFLPMVGPVPLAMAYKAASTLDSMIGYRRSPYTEIGWFSANVEDRLTWLPCRLTVITLALISRKPLQVWRLCLRDAQQDPSPNSGWSESVYAAILGVQLGGKNSYQGVIIDKPLLGDPINVINTETITQALQLTRLCFLIWLSIYTFTSIVWQF